jgi:hypothetical protein
VNAAAVADPAPEAEDDLDAFLKRFEQLVNALQDEIFKAIAVLGGEDIRGLASREIAANLNEAYAAVDDVLSAHEAASRYLEQRLHRLTDH